MKPWLLRKNNFIRWNFLVFMGSFFLISCASQPAKEFDRLKTGMDKPEVLDAVGNPKRTFRKNDKDHWIYVYYRHDREIWQDVIFSQGLVTQVSAPSQSELTDKDLESATSLQEFEQRARRLQREMHKKNAEGFQDVGD